MALPRARRAALGQEDPGRLGIARQPVGRQRPIEGHPVQNHIAILGKADGRLQQGSQLAPAVVGDDARPGIDGAGDGDGMGAIGRKFPESVVVIPVELGGIGRPAGAIEGDDLGLASRRIEDEAIAADAGRLRLDHRQHGRRGNGGIDGIAAAAHHFDGGQGCQWVGCGCGRLADAKGRAPRKLEIAHAAVTVLD